MRIPINERDDIIYCSKDKKLMLQLRKKIFKSFDKVWILVHKEINLYGIEVLNVFGSSLSLDKRIEIEEFVENFVLNFNDYETKDG